MVRRMLMLWALLLAAAPALAAVSASVDRNPIVEGETVELTVRAEGDTQGTPDFSVLDTGFRILNQSSGSQFTMAGGQTQRTRTWTVVLAPRRTGQVQIPAIPLGQAQTTPITLQVKPRGTSPDQAAPAIVEFSADLTRPYVRQQVRLSVRLLVSGTLASGGMSTPAADGAVIEQLGEQQESQTVRNGVRYRVFEREYALFPERTGPLVVEPPSFTGEIASNRAPRSMFNFGGFGDTRTVTASGDPIALEVRQVPPQAASPWLPARAVTLSQAILPDPQSVTAGVPFTREITVQVDGQLHTQLDPLRPPQPDGVQVYPEPPDGETRATVQGSRSVQTQRWAMIPTTPGALTLPPVDLHWWDTQTDTARVARIPAQVIQVQPGTGATARTAADTAPATTAQTTGRDMAATTQPGPWRMLALVAMAGWLLTGAAWLWTLRRRPRPPQATDTTPTLRAARKRLNQACHAGEPAAIRQALLDWARCRFADAGIAGLHDVDRAARACDVPARQRRELNEGIRQLDAHIYGHRDDWSAAHLLAAVEAISAHRPAGTMQGASLPPLYPTP